MSQSQAVRVTGPGKIILHGEHSVVYGKKAIAVSVGLFTTVTTIPNEMYNLNMKFVGIGIDLTFSMDKILELKAQLRPDFKYDILNESEEIPIWEEVKLILEKFSDAHGTFGENDEYLQSIQKIACQVILFLYLAIFEEPIGLSISVETELPVGAGLGSSASFAVALVGAILVAAGKISSRILPKELINRWAFVSEKFVHGNPSGVDNTVATFGGGVIFQKGKDVELISDFPDIRVLLINTKVSRSTKTLVAKVANLKEIDSKLFETCVDGIEEIVDLAIQEIKDFKKVCSKLVTKNHEYLKTLGVSHPSLELIVELAQQNGFSGKLTGAGGGGCAFILIPNNTSEESVQKLKDSLSKSEFEYWDTKLGCPGVCIY